MTYGFNDICLKPARVSNITSRAECYPYYGNKLPIFVAPMSSVINEDNYSIFESNRLNVVIPRSVPLNIRKNLMFDVFVAMGLNEFEDFIRTTTNFQTPTIYICVDVANGHMRTLLDLCSKAKSIFGDNLKLMAGNIANPDTYYDYAIAGIDYVRCNIGTGNCCTTSANTAIHYGTVSLLLEIVARKREIMNTTFRCTYKSIPHIICDGGIDSFDKAIKALALGADYVMIGKLFAQTEEACGEEVTKVVDKEVVDTIKVNNTKTIKVISTKKVSERHRIYYGMSTKKAQQEFGNNKLKTAEGIEITVPIQYNISTWCENFTDYLKSAMSYTDCKDLLEFRTKVEHVFISPCEFKSYYK